MTGLRLGLIAAVLLSGLAACSVGAPKRASNIQNIHAASDDIAAVTMTQSSMMRAHDPNQDLTIPHNYQYVTNSSKTLR